YHILALFARCASLRRSGENRYPRRATTPPKLIHLSPGRRVFLLPLPGHPDPSAPHRKDGRLDQDKKQLGLVAELVEAHFSDASPVSLQSLNPSGSSSAHDAGISQW